MPGQNLPVPGDGAHLFTIRENIALVPAHIFSAVTSDCTQVLLQKLHLFMCILLSPALQCKQHTGGLNILSPWTLQWEPERDWTCSSLTLVRREGIQNPLWGPALPLYLIKKGCLYHYEISRSQTALTSVLVYSLCCWCGLALKK